MTNQGVERMTVLAATVILADFINHPHFAHSYQIFYRDFRKKAFSSHASHSWRLRYLGVGLLIPILLVVFFSIALVTGSDKALGLSVNVMGFLVGWHYAKQGYGMLMVDASLKRRYFSIKDKRLLLANGYACWALSWVLANQLVAEKDYFGLSYYAIGIPEVVTKVLWALVGCTTVATLVVAWRALKHGVRGAPINGMMAYAVSLYLWLLYRDPLVLLVFPMLHSLQYLVVVWRYQLNYERMHAQRTAMIDGKPVASPVYRFVLFLALGGALGWLGFWQLPAYLSQHIQYDSSTLVSSSAWMIVCWVFINVHHYFIDTVIWRKGNPDTQLYLFSSGQSVHTK